MSRRVLRNSQWDRIKDLLPGKAGDRGATAQDNRRIEAVLWILDFGIGMEGAVRSPAHRSAVHHGCLLPCTPPAIRRLRADHVRFSAVVANVGDGDHVSDPGVHVPASGADRGVLEARFGDEYRRYPAQTPAFLPRWRALRQPGG